MIFRKVLDIDPKFKGGVHSDGYLARLKKWFYYGFKVCHGLSNSKMCGTGQKLPANWEHALLDMHGKVRVKQQPEMQADGSVCIAGVKVAHLCNTDHVSVWYESVGNYIVGARKVAVNVMSEPAVRRRTGSLRSSALPKMEGS